MVEFRGFQYLVGKTVKLEAVIYSTEMKSFITGKYALRRAISTSLFLTRV